MRVQEDSKKDTQNTKGGTKDGPSHTCQWCGKDKENPMGICGSCGRFPVQRKFVCIDCNGIYIQRHKLQKRCFKCNEKLLLDGYIDYRKRRTDFRTACIIEAHEEAMKDDPDALTSEFIIGFIEGPKDSVTKVTKSQEKTVTKVKGEIDA